MRANNCFRRLKLVLVLFAPLRRELPFEGVLQDRLSIDFKLPACRLEALDALVEFREEFLDLGDDAALFGEWRQGQIEFRQTVFDERCFPVTDDVSALIASRKGCPRTRTLERSSKRSLVTETLHTR